MAAEKTKGAIDVKLHELGIAEFVEQVRPSGSVIRMPGVNGDEILTYEVFLNGKAAKALGPELERQQFPSELLNGFVEKLGLDQLSFRDTSKVAELLAVRNAWQRAVHMGLQLENALGERQQLSPKVVRDWKGVSDLSHPWIKQVLQDRQVMLSQLKPALKTASIIMGVEVKDRPPEEVNKGTIVSQNGAFTIQDVGGGEVVTHTNKQLQTLPRVGDSATISYYRGQGQVFVDKEVSISKPFLHHDYNDLAIEVTDTQNGRKQTLLFGGISAFAHFAAANKLERSAVEAAIEVMAEKSERQNVRAPREPILPVGIDPQSGAISLQYREKNVVYTALFATEAQLRERAGDFDLKHDDPALVLPDNVRPLERSGPNAMSQALMDSEARAKSLLRDGEQRFTDVVLPKRDPGGPFSGPVIAQSDLHVVQDLGKGRAILHSKLDLDKVPAEGDRISVFYKSGRGSVETKPLGLTQGRDQGR